MSIQTSPIQESQATSDPFLVIDSVSKIYATGQSSYTVLEDVSLTVAEGEFICVIGHSGCGKSTLLNMVAGFNQPSQGEVRLQSRCITKPGPDRMMVFQNYCLLPWKTALENIYLAVKSVYPDKSHAEKLAIAEEHLTMVGLTEAAHKRPGQLSGGMKQRVAIARALAIRPQVLILDEPFGALDAITKEELQEELLQIWRDHRCTVLMITHDIDEALFLADRLVMMTNGPAANIGEVLDIPFARPRVRSRVMEDPRYYELRNHALDFLFRRCGENESKKIPLNPLESASKAADISVLSPSENTSETPDHPSVNRVPKLKTIALGATASILLLAGGLHLIPKITGNQTQTQSNNSNSSVVVPETPVVSSPTSVSPQESVVSAPITPVSKASETSEMITDAVKLEALNQKLYDLIDQNWWVTPTFTEDLIYRVTLNGDGEIVSYQTENQAALDYRPETPFGQLQEFGEPQEVVTKPGSQPVAHFEVILTPNGELKVTSEK